MLSRAEEIKRAFSILELPETANLAEIKTKYKKLALQYHPDRVALSLEEKQAAHEKFVPINLAYECLVKNHEKAELIDLEKYPELKPEYWKVYFTSGMTGEALGCRKMITFERIDLSSDASLALYSNNQLANSNNKIAIACSYLKEVAFQGTRFDVRSLACIGNIFANLTTLGLTPEEMREVLGVQDDSGRTILAELVMRADSQDQMQLYYSFFKLACEIGHDFTIGCESGHTTYDEILRTCRRPRSSIIEEFKEATQKSFYQRAQNALVSLFNCKSLSTGILQMQNHYNKNPTPEKFIEYCIQVIEQRGETWGRNDETKKVYKAISQLVWLPENDDYIFGCLLELEYATSEYKKVFLPLPVTTLDLKEFELLGSDLSPVQMIENTPDKNSLDSLLLTLDQNSVTAAFLWAKRSYLKYDLFGSKKENFEVIFKKIKTEMDEDGVLVALSSFFKGAGNTDSTSLKRLVLNGLLGTQYEIEDIIKATNSLSNAKQSYPQNC